MLRWFRLVAVALIVVLLAASCGDDDGDSASSTTGDGASNTTQPAATGPEIVVGGLVTKAIFPGSEIGARARFERANREGGVNGRMIKYLGDLDDGGDSAKALDQTRQLILQDKVMAILPVMTPGFLPQVSDVAIDAKVPFFGYGFMPGFCGTEYGFGFNGCNAGDSIPTSMLEAISTAIDKDPTELRFAALAGDSLPGKAGIGFVKAVADYLDADLVYAEANFPVQQPTVDYTPYVQQLLAAKPDVITLYIDFANDIGMIAALHAAGFTGPITSTTSYVPGILDSQPDLAAEFWRSSSRTCRSPCPSLSASSCS